MVFDEQTLSLLDLSIKDCTLGRINGQPDYVVDFLKSLVFIFHDNRKFVESAMEIADGNEAIISHIVSSTTIHPRQFWKLKGSHGSDYICMSNFCSCPSFLQQARNPHAHGVPFCKHLLSIKVCSALGKCKSTILSEEEFVKSFSNED
jgi:predicted nucleic acid-binding Zn finger protein